jgi:hypothetical protein
MNKLAKILLSEYESQLLPDSTHYQVATKLVEQIPAEILNDRDELEHFEYVFRNVLDELIDKNF